MERQFSIICLLYFAFEVSETVAGPLTLNGTEKHNESEAINMRSQADMKDWFYNVLADALQAGSYMLREHHHHSHIAKFDPERDHIQGGGQFAGGHCDCKDFICLCCSDLNIFGLDNKTCTRLTYDPASSSVHMHVKTQNHYHISTFSVKEAKTRCFPIRVPYIPEGDFLEICVGFYNVSEAHDGILNLCMAANGRLNKQTLVTLYYDCMVMGEGAQAFRPPNYDKYDKNVPGIFDTNIFPSTSPMPPSGEVHWAPLQKIPKGKFVNGKYSKGELYRHPVVQGLARFLAKWLF